MKYYEYRLKSGINIHLSEDEHQGVQNIIFSGKHQLVTNKDKSRGFYTNEIKGWRYDSDYKDPNDNTLSLPEMSKEIEKDRRNNTREYLKKIHFSFYEKMGFEHKADCSCKSWVLN